MNERARVSQIYYHELIKSKFPPKKILLFRNSNTMPFDEIMTMAEHNAILNKAIPDSKFNLLDLKDFKEIDDDRVIIVSSENINDKIVIEAINNHLVGNTLIAATGILKEPILSLKHIRLINVHSGYLPESRGLENFFYSLLYNKSPGISIHEVNEGVDTGNILFRNKLDFNLRNKGLEEFEKNKIFVTLKYFIVPYLKTKVFTEYLEWLSLQPNEEQYIKIEQNIEDGRTFYKIHHELKEVFMNMIISD